VSIEYAALIADAEARSAAARAEVDDLRRRLADDLAAAKSDDRHEDAAPRRLTAEDGREAARRRHPGRTRSEAEANKGTGSGDVTGDAQELTGWQPALPLPGAAGTARDDRLRGADVLGWLRHARAHRSRPVYGLRDHVGRAPDCPRPSPR
jgi:hypothetical protein